MQQRNDSTLFVVDSLFLANTEIKTTASLVKEQRVGKEGRPLYKPNYDTILLGTVSLSVFLFFLLYFQIQRNKFRRITSYSRYFKFDEEKKSQLFVYIHLLRYVLSFITFVGLLYYLLLEHTDFSNWQTYSYIFATLLLFLFLRMFLIFFIGFLIKKNKVAQKHNETNYLINGFLGFFYFPLLLIALLAPLNSYEIVLYSVLIVFIIRFFFVLFYVYKLLRKSFFSVFHSFLYLCTLEMLPIIYLVVIIDIFYT